MSKRNSMARALRTPLPHTRRTKTARGRRSSSHAPRG